MTVVSVIMGRDFIFEMNEMLIVVIVVSVKRVVAVFMGLLFIIFMVT